MEEYKVNFDTALMAKEKGFDEICYYHFGSDGHPFESRNPQGSKNSQWVKCVARPTQAFLQQWLREVHEIDVNPVLKAKGFKFYNVSIVKYNTIDYTEDQNFTFTQALEFGLLKGLKLIPEKS
jgi:hypothetical protein